jgi:nucleotide-binding universal stress UspA family protein
MTFTHLLVPVDGSELSDQAVSRALELAGVLGARVTFVHAEPGLPMALAGLGEPMDSRTLEMLASASREQSQMILAEACRRAEESGIQAERLSLVNPMPHAAIVEAAGQVGADLIVMASHGRRGIGALLLGSETQKVLTHCTLPVLVVR